MRHLAIPVFLIACSVLRADSYQYTFFSAPQATRTEITGLNNSGAAVGYYYTDNSTTVSQIQSFVYQNGQFTTLPLPGTGTSGVQVQADAINDLGQITGNLNDSVFIDTNGSFTYFNIAGYQYVEPTSINNLGEVIGWASGGGQNTALFTYKAGVISLINAPPGEQFDEGVPLSINDSGQIVSTVCRINGPACNPLQESFLLSNGTMSLFGVSGSGVLGTYAYAIGDSGVITGIYYDAAGEHGFRDDNGVFTTFELPQPLDTYSFQAMNVEEQTAGAYQPFPADVVPAYIATPTSAPEPRSLATCGTGIFLLCCLVAYRRSSLQPAPRLRANPS